MLSSVLASVLVSQATATSTPVATTVTYNSGFFVITDGSGTTKVNTKQWAKPHPTTFEFKTGKAVLKWDWKGLSVTVGKKVRTSTLADLPTSPKFFDAEKLANVKAEVTAKEWKLDVTGLSGWEQIGNMMYLVPRWESKGKQTWLEMLIKVDLSKASPWFETVGVLDGGSKANSIVEDRLFKCGDGLAMVSEKEGDWGISSWSLSSSKSSFVSIGSQPQISDVNADGSVLRFIESTTYGTHIAGMATLPDGKRTDFAETRDPIFFPGDAADIVQINAATGVVLRNTDSGLELRLPANVGVRNVAPGVLVWVPRESPTQAVLYSKSGLRALARWKATPAKPKPPVRQP